MFDLDSKPNQLPLLTRCFALLLAFGMTLLTLDRYLRTTW
jgi:hypothetical protein